MAGQEEIGYEEVGKGRVLNNERVWSLHLRVLGWYHIDEPEKCHPGRIGRKHPHGLTFLFRFLCALTTLMLYVFEKGAMNS